MRIYIACLASYNNGRLHGRWIDATSDVDEMSAEIRKILRTSPFPNVRRQDFGCRACDKVFVCTLPYDGSSLAPLLCDACPSESPVEPDGEHYPSAEEWAIHDYDGVRPHGMGEHTSLDTVAAWLAVLEKADDAGIPEEVAAELAEQFGEPGGKEPFTETLEKLESEYAGCHRNLAEWAESLEEETGGLESVPERLRNYIDFDALGNDARLGGDIIPIGCGGDTYVFWSR